MLLALRLFCIVGFLPGLCLAEVIDLGGDWKVGSKPVSGPEQPGFDVADWPSVHVPHNFSEIGMSIPRRGGTIWFRRSFIAPPVADKQRAILQVINGAAAQAWINGHPAGQCSESSFWMTHDITELLQSGRNSVAIKTQAPGIQGGVRLHVVQEVHLDPVGILVDVPEWSGGPARVRVRAQVRNLSSDQQTVALQFSVRDPQNELLATTSPQKITIAAGHTLPVELVTPQIAQPPLWSIDHPAMSSAQLELTTEKGSQMEAVDFGFRWFRFETEQGFFLNGKPLKLRGPVFTAIGPQRFSDRAALWAYEIGLLKEMGVNFIRPTPGIDDRIFAECDRAGILTTIRVHDFGESEDGGPNELRENMRHDVRQKFNHPSAIAWNVVGEGSDAARAAMHSEAFRTLKAIDPSRGLLCNELGWRSPGTVGLLEPDIAGQGNYTGWYEGTLDHIGPYMDNYRELILERYQRHLPMIVSNYGAAADPSVHSNAPRRNDYSVEYHTAFHQRFDRELAARPWMAGGLIFCWRDIDGGQAVPRHTWKGIVDLHEQKRDAYYYYQSAWTSHPMVHIASKDWNERSHWPAASMVAFEVFSNCAEVELLHQGNSLGTRKKAEGYHWQVPLVAGENRVIAHGRIEGTEVEDRAKINVNLQPPAVEPRLAVDGKRLRLVWEPLAGVDEYIIYGGDSADFAPSPASQLGVVAEPTWEYSAAKYGMYFRVAAVGGTPSAAVGWGLGGLQWQHRREGWLMSSPALADLDADGKLEIVIGAYSGELVAISADGQLLWEFNTGDPVFSSPVVCSLEQYAPPSIVFTSTTGLTVLDAKGKLRWHVDGIRTFDRNPKSPAVGDLEGDGHAEIVVASDTGELRVFDHNGHEKWRFTTADFANRGLMLTNPLVIDSPTDGQKWVCFAADNGVTYLLDGTGNELWRRDARLGLATPGLPPTTLWPAAGALEPGGATRIVTGGRSLQVFDLQGQLLWERPDLSGAPHLVRLDATGQRAIVVYRRERMTAVDGQGRDLWTYRLGSTRDFFTQPPVSADVDEDGRPDLLVGTRGTYLKILDGKGREQWSVKTDDEVSGTAAVADINADGYAEIVFGSRDGFVRVIGGGKVPRPALESRLYRGSADSRGDYSGSP